MAKRLLPSNADMKRPYTAEELEFLKAIDRYKRLHRRPHPNWAEVLRVARDLGYRKAET